MLNIVKYFLFHLRLKIKNSWTIPIHLNRKNGKWVRVSVMCLNISMLNI